jgi:hypothetical protein
MAATKQKFSEELKTYEEHRPAWLSEGKEGHWVAVLGGRIVGPDPSLDSVWDTAVETFGSGFMVKRIFRVEKPIIVSNFKMTKGAGSS